MAFIDSAEVGLLKEKLTSDLSHLGRLFKSKNSEYQTRNVEHNLVEPMLEEGWEEYGSPLKTKTKLRKLKSHDVCFEDDVWCQLYKLGYRHLNLSNDFKLPYGKGAGEKKQIDIIAINEDSILLVECKSSKKPAKAPSYKTEFEGLQRRLAGFSKTLEQLFGKGRKVKYIFATRNLRLNRDSADIKRLLDTGSFFYNDNTHDYINGLISKYKDAAHYQFLALLFKGKLINKEKIEVPAIEGKMGKETYYMFSLEPHLLLKMGFVLHRTRANEAEMPTYQRLLVPSRLKGIAKFIEDGGYFPNSIVLNFSKTENKLQFQAVPNKGHSRSRFGTLKIPNAYAIAYIIDGQHRVYGYANSDFKESNTIPVVAFYGLESSEQLKLFMDINENQKAVSPTLRITLEEDLLWNSKKTDSRIKALRSSIIRELGGDATGPLFGKISLGEDKALLSANPFAKVLTRCGLLPQTKGNKYVQETAAASLYDTHNLDHSVEMRTARARVVGFLNCCYQFVEDSFVENEELSSTFILSNRGTFAFISLIGSLNTFETENGNISIKTTPEDRFESIRKYLHVMLNALKTLPTEKEESILGKLGTGAENTWFRFFQELVNQRYPKYEPSDLLDWKERQDQELQDKGRTFGTKIERHIKNTVISKLKELFNENWDIEIGSIQRECENRASEQMEKNYKEGLGRAEIPWTDQFFVTDYKKIIEKYWTRRPDNDTEFVSFENIFSIDIGNDFNSKSDKLKWISIFNSYRNLWAHEGTKEKGLNHKEVAFLEKIYDFFHPQN
jgi:DNA sulfur modification protein DndB